MPLNNHHASEGGHGPLEKITAEREINASAADIFDLLSNPERHAETDPEGHVLSVEKGQRLKAVGDTFVMNMTNDNGDDYQTRNKVFAFSDGRAIGWQNEENVTKGVEVGSRWLYELEPVDADTTKVSLTYDPTAIDNPAVEKVAQNYDAKALESSLANLADALS